MPKPTIDLTQHPKFQKRQRERQAARQQRQSEQVAELGRQAFQDFLGYRGKLTPNDREVIARNLCSPVEDYYANHPDEERYLLLQDAGLTDEKSTKVLPRLVLRSGQPISTKDGLYASPEKYRWLIEAIARRSGESLDGLASSVLLGTSFYPHQPESPVPDISEAHLILAALQEAVDRVDDEFHLLEQCLEVARLRNEVEAVYWKHVAETGEDLDYESWHSSNPNLVLPQPDWPQTWPGSSERFSNQNGLWWPLEDWRLVDWDHGDGERLIVPDNTYWARTGIPADPCSSRVLSGPDFFFFPHIYLGPAKNWEGERDPEQHAWVQNHLPNSEEPQVCWEEDKQRYVLRQSEYPLPDGTTSTEYDLGGPMDEAARWLVIYPDPFMKKLVPMIYALGEFPGAELTQLTAPLIADFSNQYRWEYFGKGAPTLLQRLKDLTGYRTGDFKVYEAWRETALRFHWNPILRRHPEVIDEIRYRKHLERWVAQGRPDAGKDDEED
jgi:hypothetical protein